MKTSDKTAEAGRLKITGIHMQTFKVLFLKKNKLTNKNVIKIYQSLCFTQVQQD